MFWWHGWTEGLISGFKLKKKQKNPQLACEGELWADLSGVWKKMDRVITTPFCISQRWRGSNESSLFLFISTFHGDVIQWKHFSRNWPFVRGTTSHRCIPVTKASDLCFHLVHDDVIKWKYFSNYWPFMQEIHVSLINSRYQDQRLGALMFSLIYASANGWANNWDAIAPITTSLMLSWKGSQTITSINDDRVRRCF